MRYAAEAGNFHVYSSVRGDYDRHDITKDVIKSAVVGGCVKIMEHLWREDGVTFGGEELRVAIHNDNVDAANWIMCKHNPNLRKQTIKDVDNVAETCSAGMMEFLVEKCLVDDVYDVQSALKAATRRDRHDMIKFMLKWMQSHDMKPYVATINGALMNGSIRIVDMFIKHGVTPVITDTILESIRHRGHFMMLRWVKDHCPQAFDIHTEHDAEHDAKHAASNTGKIICPRFEYQYDNVYC